MIKSTLLDHVLVSASYFNESPVLSSTMLTLAIDPISSIVIEELVKVVDPDTNKLPSITTFPPTFKFLATPAPPAIVTAPESEVVESVSSSTLNVPTFKLV